MKITAACHVHSEWSYDAKWTLNEIATAFGGRGCSAVMMTEHDRDWNQTRWQEYKTACAKASTPEVLIIPGIEYSDPRNDIHVLVWGSEDFLGEGLETHELLMRVKDVNASAVFAHPERRKAWSLFRDEWYESLLGIEVWNRKTDGWAPTQRGIEAWKGTDCIPFASLDFHRRNQFHPLRMVLDVPDFKGLDSIFQALASRKLEPFYRGNPLTHTLDTGGPVGLRKLEILRRALRKVIPH